MPKIESKAKMELKLALHKEKLEPSKVASGWITSTETIETIDDAKKIFCKYSFSPHEWENGRRKQENHISTHFIVADYDEGLTIEEAQKRFKPHNYILITSITHFRLKTTRNVSTGASQ